MENLDDLKIYAAQNLATYSAVERLHKELFPILESIAKQEFGTIAISEAEWDEDTINDVNYSEKKIEAMICSYLRQLAKFYCNYGKLYSKLGECDTEKEIDAFFNNHLGK